MRVSIVTTVLLLHLASIASAGTLRGRVSDAENADPGTNGLGGVEVVVKDAQEHILASGTTDALGRYEIHEDLPLAVDVFFTLQGYRKHPTKKPHIKLTGETTIVNAQMFEETATEVYNRGVARRIADADTATQEVYQAIVDDLPKEQCEFIRASLRELARQTAHTTRVVRGLTMADEYPLPGVMVSLVQAEACAPCLECNYKAPVVQHTVTRENGEYRFDGVPDGSYVLHAEMGGMQDARERVEVASTAQAAVIRDVPMLYGVVEAITVTADAPLIDITGAAPNQPLVVVPKRCLDFRCILERTAVQSDEEGRVTLPLYAGEYGVIVPSVDSAPTTRTFEVNAHQSMTVDVSRPPR